jgi:gliding motility-associated-like protein
MRLDNDMGDVDTNFKNIVLDSFMSEKAYATHGVGCSYWLLSHKYNSADFVAFKIDNNGVNLEPVVSPASLGVDTSTWLSYIDGELKISQDGKMIANTNGRMGLVELSSFDRASGVVSDTRILDTLYVDAGSAAAIGLSFSPDGSKLYASPWYRSFVQYDLDMLPDITAVRSSRVILGDSGIYRAMRLGPDNKLYIIYEDDHSQLGTDICCVNSPNSGGFSCNPSVLRTPGGNDMDPRLALGNPLLGIYKRTTRLTDTVFCIDQPVAFSGPSDYDTYLWDNGDTTATRYFANSTMAWVSAGSACSSETDTFRIKVENCNCIVSIPNAFSPNGDGRNDRFGIIAGDLQSFHMEVYNRWGQPVFYTSTIGHSWDGTFNGVPCNADTYYYYVKLKCIKGEEVFRKGDVTLLR